MTRRGPCGQSEKAQRHCRANMAHMTHPMGGHFLIREVPLQQVETRGRDVATDDDATPGHMIAAYGTYQAVKARFWP